jgi:hypothetical protein
LRVFLTILFFVCITQIFAQEQNTGGIKRVIKYGLEAGTIISSNGETPFWLRANQYGTVPLTSPIFTLRGSVSSDYTNAVTKEDQYKRSKFDWGYGLNVVGNVGKENQFLIPEAYLKAKYGAFEIYAGRRKEIVGLVDTTLSSGSYIWSGNALPMPKVQISTPNFVPLGFTGGFLSFKGSYAHGWFENSRTDVKNFYLHQKTLYLRLGKPDWKFHFYGGFNHQVQWGGELLYADPKNVSGINGKVGSSFNDYIGVVTGRSNAVEGDTTKNGGNDAGNRSGNHLGTIDFGFEVNAKNFSVLIYRQNIYEDGSLAYLNNISDGLNGLSITFKENPQHNVYFKKIVFEYLNTTSQGGIGGSENTNARLRGQDNYFNNSVYQDGWIYSNQTLGTPFITTNSRGFTNNRVETFHIGIESFLNKVPLMLRLTHSNNYSPYGTGTTIKGQLYALLQTTFNIRNGFILKTSLAIDNGALEGNKIGLGITLRKIFN